MVTKLEIEHFVVGNNRTNRSRRTLFEIGDRAGKHTTHYGEVGLNVLERSHRYGCNRDVVFDFSQSAVLQYATGRKLRRISIDGMGKGSQQIGEGVTLFVSCQLSTHENGLIVKKKG